MSNRKKTPNLLDDLLAAPGKSMNVNTPKAQSQSTTTVAEASSRLGVGDKTIRKWASDFGGNLSQGANPGKGQPRYFSDEDMVVLTTIGQQRSANVSYDDIHKAFRYDRSEDLQLPADKLPDDRTQPTTPGSSQKYEDRLMLLEKERDQLRKQLKATKAELAATQKALAGEQKTETSMEDVLVEDLPPPDSKKADRPGEPQADPGRIMTLEDQLKHLGKKPWWQVWKR
jgi:DNA-binding transcriptional MerR regulator